MVTPLFGIPNINFAVRAATDNKLAVSSCLPEGARKRMIEQITLLKHHGAIPASMTLLR
jgi:hypothetical protein